MPRSISRCPKRPQLPGGVPRLGDDAIRIGMTVLAALFSPLMGALLAGWFAYDADRDGRLPTRNLMILLLGFQPGGPGGLRADLGRALLRDLRSRRGDLPR